MTFDSLVELCYNRAMKTFKYRLCPTKSQRTQLQHMLDTCRWTYNKTLEVRRDAWQEHGVSLSLYDTNRLMAQWRAGDEWVSSGHAQAQQNAQLRVDLAFQAFFRRVKAGQEPGYPRFRCKERYDSFTYPQEKGNWRFLDDGRLRLSKIGAVKIKLHRPIEGRAKTLTIRRGSVSNWYACFSCETQVKLLPVSTKMVGIDLGLTTFATLSNGEKIERQRWIKRDAKDSARLQRKKERLTKGSPERKKAVCALQHAYQRQTNRRNDFAHQESRRLVNRYGLIVFEDLDIQGMQENGNRTINKGIADVAWAKFMQYTQYKAAEAGRACLLVNPRGTTQECSGCGTVVPKDLSVRVHDCPHCGLKMDRDLNASLNILARGLSSLGRASGPKSSLIYRGEQSPNSQHTAMLLDELLLIRQSPKGLELIAKVPEEIRALPILTMHSKPGTGVHAWLPAEIEIGAFLLKDANEGEVFFETQNVAFD